MDSIKRTQNQRKFPVWSPLPDGGRRYSLEVKGHHGWKAVYVKEVDSEEGTVSFRQEIFDDRGVLVEVHVKYPVDTGHQKKG